MFARESALDLDGVAKTAGWEGDSGGFLGYVSSLSALACGVMVSMLAGFFDGGVFSASGGFNVVGEGGASVVGERGPPPHWLMKDNTATRR